MLIPSQSVNRLRRIALYVGVLALMLGFLAQLGAMRGCADAGGAASPSLFTELSPGKNGVFTLDGLQFMVVHKSDRWAPSWQRDITVTPGFPVASPGDFELKGTLNTDSGPYAFTQSVKQIDDASVGYATSISGSPTKASNLLCLSITLPVDIYRGQKVYFDNQECDLPWWQQGESLTKSLIQAKAVRIPLQHGGTLVISGDISAYFQDLRDYNDPIYDLQIYFSAHSGMIAQSNLAVTIARVPAANTLAVAYDTGAKRPPREQPKLNRVQTPQTDPALVAQCRADLRPLPLVRPKGDDFVDPFGKQVRFWGMNVVAFYPDHELADKTADNLASLGINIVRLHHDLRPSTDWEPADTASLLTYDADSRTPNLKAWDRYDYLNAKLREKGIYISATIHGTRTYLPGDVSILHVSAQDDEDWADAMDELNHWNWQKAFDPRKMLPVFDERCFLLNAEFAKYYLSHVNPYTALAYGKDSQIVSLEFVNEFSTEYTLTCGNVFPDYWTRKLNAMLADYAVAHGVTPFELYARKTREQAKCFSDFCNSLDQAYTQRMEKIVRDAGYDGPIEFSNLWRGDAELRMRTKMDGVIEDHAYDDPLVVKDPDNFLLSITNSAVAGKPLVIGEFDRAENQQLAQVRKPVVSMTPVAAAVYSSLQDYSGVIWFAWAHGTFNVGPDGWGKGDPRSSANIGLLAGCGPILDQLRAAGIVYKNHYLESSTDPKTTAVDDSYFATNYSDLMAGESPIKPGWQLVHAFRKVFGPVPADQSAQPWMIGPPPTPTISDTKQIVRDSRRKQLSFAAPKTEGFSGYLDGKPIANLAVLDIPGSSGFASVIVVALDDKPLAHSKSLLVSRTFTDAAGSESPAVAVNLHGLTRAAWRMRITRPIAGQADGQALETSADGIVTLPESAWNECELDAK